MEGTKKNLEQRLLAVRAAIPRLAPKKYSDGVKYKFNKISDVYEFLNPALTENGVLLHIAGELPCRWNDGSAVYWQPYETKTKYGDARTLWIYESEINLEWVNADSPEEKRELTIHALGTNDGGPDKAKGSAWTYALKYFLFEELGVDQGEDDPDSREDDADGRQARTTRQTSRQAARNTTDTKPAPAAATAPAAAIPGGAVEPTDEERAIYREALQTCASMLDKITDAASANAALARWKLVKHAAGSDRVTAQAWTRKIHELGLVWAAGLKQYVQAPAAPAEKEA